MVDRYVGLHRAGERVEGVDVTVSPFGGQARRLHCDV